MSTDKLFYKPEKIFTANEAVALMHEFNAESLRHISDYIERFKPDPEHLVKLFRGWADEVEAQSIVVSLRDKI